MNYPEHPDIDLNAAVKRLGGRHAMLEKLLLSFLDKYLNAEETLRQSNTDNDFEPAASLAHQIKGAGLNLGANGVAKHAAHIELTYKSGKASSEEQLLKLSSAINELADYLKLNSQAQ